MPSPESKVGASAARSRFIFWIRWLELAALFLAGVYALLFQVRLPSRLPTEVDYRAVAAEIEKEAQPEDAVLLYPWWTERARLFLPATIPVVGYLGYEADPLEDYRRIWLVAQPNLPRSNLSAFLSAFQKQRPQRRSQRFGNLELDLFENRLHRRKTFSATDELAKAHVYLESASGQRTECQFDGRVQRCPLGNLYVAAEWHEIHFSPQRCLWMHPPGGATRLVAEFSNPAPSNRLVLRAGLVWDREYLRPGTTAVNIRVDTGDGRTAIDLTIPPGREGLQRAEAPGDAVAGASAVRLSVASENPELRDVCVDLSGQGPLAREGG